MNRTGEIQIYVIPLSSLSSRDSRVGSKAGNLGELAQAGFPVPNGFVVTIQAFARFIAANRLTDESSPEKVLSAEIPPDIAVAIDDASASFGNESVAVRSSGVSEDLPGASFAGQYETLLNVHRAEAIKEAVRQCWASAFGQRVTAYRKGLGRTGNPSMAVLVQRMVQARAAGVAFTADPITGDRSVVLISAVRGLGERLVSGQTTPDEWVVRGTDVTCRQAPERAITEDQIRAVADLARRVERYFGEKPQDIEWAINGRGELFLLQARPITALPEPVSWESPFPGRWARNFRLGEWLGDPLTPLFETWAIPRLDDAFWAEIKKLVGFSPPAPPHAVVNGWYFASLNWFPRNPIGVLLQLLRHPRIFRIIWQSVPRLAKMIVRGWVREWKEVALPRYRKMVQKGEKSVDHVTLPELMEIVDSILSEAGRYFFWIAAIGGGGYRSEISLAQFYHRHLTHRIGGSHQQLLCGLGETKPSNHSVLSLDWFHPTLGEILTPYSERNAAERRAKAEAARVTAEAEVRSALSSQPRRLRKFEQVLEVAQWYARLREEIIGSFTMGWPLIRRSVSRLGAHLQATGLIVSLDDVFFLTYDELRGAIMTNSVQKAEDLRRLADKRKKTWKFQRQLTPPLVMGGPPSPLWKYVEKAQEGFRAHSEVAVEGIRGLPASPGRAIGQARIIHVPEEFDRVQGGDVLVAPATTPAWSPLFSRIVAVVTDTGSPVAHASLVAREYGIPAVVATADATSRLRDGQVVTVDGNEGVVLIVG